MVIIKGKLWNMLGNKDIPQLKTLILIVELFIAFKKNQTVICHILRCTVIADFNVEILISTAD